MAKTALETIASGITQATSGDAWYGSATLRLVSDLTAAQAVMRPAAGGHSVWEILLHASAWRREVLARVSGALAQTPVDGDWPAVGEVTDTAWTRVQAEYAALGERLAQAVAAAPDDVWSAMVGRERSPELGTGVTVGAMIVGIVQHDAYHSGQIALLRKQILDSPDQAT